MFPVSAVVIVTALLVAFNEAVRENAIWYSRKVAEKISRQPADRHRDWFLELSRWSSPAPDAGMGQQSRSGPAYATNTQ